MGHSIKRYLKMLGPIVALLACSFLFSACDTMRTIIGSDSEPPPIPGKRISILALEKSLEPDPELAGQQITLPRPYINSEWAQVDGSPSHMIGHPAADGPLLKVWSTTIGKGETKNNPILTSPIIVGQMLFAMDARSNVSAVRLGATSPAWKKMLVPAGEEPEGSVGGGLAYDQDTLYAATAYGYVLALNPQNGGVYWWKNIGVPIRGSPIVADSRVFVLSIDNTLHVLNHRDGTILWKHQGIEENAGLLGTASVAVSKDLVVVPYSSGELFAMRVENGRVAWSDSLVYQGRLGAYTQLSDIDASPVIVENTVYAGSNSGRLVAIDLRTGSPLWEQEIASSTTPWIAGNYLFIVTTGNELICLNRINGKIHWIATLPKFSDPEDRKDMIIWTRPTLVGDRLLVANNFGEVRALSPYSGKTLGNISVKDGIRVSPIVARGTVYVLTTKADIIALR